MTATKANRFKRPAALVHRPLVPYPLTSLSSLPHVVMNAVMLKSPPRRGKALPTGNSYRATRGRSFLSAAWADSLNLPTSPVETTGTANSAHRTDHHAEFAARTDFMVESVRGRPGSCLTTGPRRYTRTRVPGHPAPWASAGVSRPRRTRRAAGSVTTSKGVGQGAVAATRATVPPSPRRMAPECRGLDRNSATTSPPAPRARRPPRGAPARNARDRSRGDRSRRPRARRRPAPHLRSGRRY